jgi:hypothetical protein
MSSFHSEYDSLDLSEKHINDESFKLGTHAFSQVQTMDQINVRHEDDELHAGPIDKRQRLMSQSKTRRQL